MDKSSWGPGPWQDEPDRLDFYHAGLPCLLKRGPSSAWCGYVAVPPSHPLHGKDYDAPEVYVHGGLTYADACSDNGVCHVPAPGEPDNVWWFGFDCHHAGDVAPKYEAMFVSKGWPILGDVYRDMAYAKAETERLAEQLAKAA